MHLLAATRAAMIDKRITDLGGLISLALALATVFTATRSAALVTRAKEQGKTKWRVMQALALDLLLFAATIALTLAAVPLFLDAARNLDVTDSAGALRSVFAIVWLLLVGLVAWQLGISWRTFRQMHGRPWRARRPGQRPA
jgi:hypothetical protein